MRSIKRVNIDETNLKCSTTIKIQQIINSPTDFLKQELPQKRLGTNPNNKINQQNI